MDLDKIKELVEMMKANDLSELEIIDGQTRIAIKRGPSPAPPQIIAMSAPLTAGGMPIASASFAPAADAGPLASPEKAPEDNYLKIVSPLVGTLYLAPSPNADYFVAEGTHVDEDTVVCIIEAMKVMNEIKSDLKGTIKKILTTNGTAVEYGQTLFLVEPDK